MDSNHVVIKPVHSHPNEIAKKNDKKIITSLLTICFAILLVFI